MSWHTAAVLSIAAALIGFAGAAVSPPPRARNAADALATPLLAGLLVAFTLLLGLGAADRALYALCAVAAIGVARIAWRARGGRLPSTRKVLLGAVPLAVLFVPLALIAASALYTPIGEWDARSEWFFQAKIIAHLQGIVADPVWVRGEYGFASMFYPKLLPSAGAVLPLASGTWNEFLPKGGLLLLALPALVAVASVAAGRFTEWFLLIALFLPFGDHLTTGMVDTYYGIYVALGVLFVARGEYFRALLCIGIAWSLKAEGVLAALCVAAALLLSWRWLAPRVRPIDGWGAAIALVPTALWWIVKGQWGLGALQHAAFRGDMSAHILARIPEAPLILDWMVLRSDLWRVAAIAALAIVAGSIWLRRLPAGAAFIVAFAAAYFCGMALMFAGTDIEPVERLLEVAAARTMVPVALALLAAVYLMLDKSVEKLERIGGRGKIELATPTMSTLEPG